MCAKSLSVVVVLLGVLSMGGTAVAQEAEIQSVVPNASVEQGANEQPADWSYYAWDKEQSRGWWADEHARSGSRSLGMQGLNSGCRGDDLA